ncbi:helix-turn-helix domain-containing protein [Halovenus sp. WSH3]|uniref:Helix-turn-helix domain-containing protein n=1 Tax=Halovenus carboxidivorans TaxID=2692199 RepID=A0A6B0SX95_9EURY|nr:helix-turn-helix domain-containing protein [Halovenus carboxidivorans]MXR50328.1 helix-turn-helix domain-containing protein [Halovenus carboxidivorans]
MPEARLQITLPEAVWIGQLSRQYPDGRFRILAALSDGDSGVGLAEIYSAEISSLLADMRAAEDIREVEVLNDPGDRALVQFETEQPLLLLAARDSGVPLEMPVELEDGTLTWEVTAPSDRLSELGTQLRALGLSFSIDYIQQEVGDDQLLTDAQEQIIETAISEGYYDTPRTCSLTELAESVDRAKSTVSETLHRAESKIITEFVSEPDDEESDLAVLQ